MFLRFVRLRLRPGCLWAFREFYERRIAAALQEVDGCLHAVLLLPASPADDACLSMTLWQSAAHAEAYAANGLYDALLDESDPYLAGATEWRTDLDRLQPVRRTPLQDPEVETYPVEVSRLAEGEGGLGATGLFLRIVVHRVDPVRFDEMRKRYESVIAPALLQTPGCRAAMLAEGLRGRTEALSVTLWASEDDALRYEDRGRFDELVGEVREFLSGLYQWKLSLVGSGGPRPVEGRDLTVRGFHVVVGKRLRG